MAIASRRVENGSHAAVTTYLHALLDAEISTRGEPAIERRLRAARLPARTTLALFVTPR